ncbi:MAG: protein translocase subunit SecD [Candidatus Marinimicrobia bacterium]|nr:protein translocase subunit SecD [Candidatus Neomarinimicrobiota bacterium]
MNNKLTPRYLIIGVALVWALWALWPTIRYNNLSDEQKETMKVEGTLYNLESKIIKQGLDLKGGMHIVLEADIPTLVSNLAQNKDSKFERMLEEVQVQLVAPDADFFVLFKQAVTDNNIKLRRYYNEYGASDEDILAGLEEEADDAINRVLEILQNRVDQFGVSEPTIQKQGGQRIIVELAGIDDPERARSLLQSTALLEFFIVKSPDLTNDILLRIDNILKGSDELADIASLTDTTEARSTEPAPLSEDKTVSVSELFGEPDVTEASDGDTSSVVVDERLFEERPFSSLIRGAQNDIIVPEANVYAIKKILAMPEVQEKLDAGNGQFLFGNEPTEVTDLDGNKERIYRLYYLEKEAELTGGVIEEANATIGGQGGGASGQSVVLLSMNGEGTKQWARITGSNVGRRVAIVLDSKVHMAPNIREKIPSGGTQIEGFANMNEAKDIAIVLRAGALPAPVKIIEERIIGSSLGSDSIKKGTNSILIGLALVLVFMMVYYKWSGSIANFALIWNIILVLAVLASLDATLTLPGIAGLILTIGMSIDANVIIFERIREEERKGKTPKSAIEAGYSRALSTIIDANITTLIAALVLYQYGTGPIRGFATVLFWGILISMFTAIYVTRTIFNTFTQRKGLQRLSI